MVVGEYVGEFAGGAVAVAVAVRVAVVNRLDSVEAMRVAPQAWLLSPLGSQI